MIGKARVPRNRYRLGQLRAGCPLVQIIRCPRKLRWRQRHRVHAWLRYRVHTRLRHRVHRRVRYRCPRPERAHRRYPGAIPNCPCSDCSTHGSRIPKLLLLLLLKQE